LKLKLGHLFADKLNLYGDMGNVLTLKYRLEKRGYEVEIEQLNDSNFTISNYDFLFIGGGQDKEQQNVAKLLESKKSDLSKFIEDEKPMLAICGGYQLLGESYLTSDKETISGLGILNVITKAKEEKNAKNFQDRLVGNVVAELDFPLHIESSVTTLVGFENHSGRTFITDSRTSTLATVKLGFGNNDTDKKEGARYKNLFASYLHGSLLPKNPHFADEIIYLTLLAKFGKAPELKKIDDVIEIRAHKKALTLH
jgi:CobQ-like glutamine amidotransferase family enzyme